MNTKQILETVFNDVRLVTFVYDNRQVWFASQIAEVLGYARPNVLSDQIRTIWRDDFVEGEDFYSVSFQDISNLQIEDRLNLSSKARHFILLTESGIDGVLIGTKKRIGKDLRSHLRTVALPQFRRGMIVERPVEELEEVYRQELYQLKDDLLRVQRKVIERDDKLIERDERIMELQDERAEWLGEAPYVRKMASSAGKSLQACKGARKTLGKECQHLRLVEEDKKAK